MRASLSASASPASAARHLAGRLARLALALIRGEDQRAPQPASQPEPGGAMPPPQLDAEGLFALAVRAGPAVDMDWMWLYTQMTGSFERLYCIEKALARDPENAAARAALQQLSAGARGGADVVS